MQTSITNTDTSLLKVNTTQKLHLLCARDVLTPASRLLTFTPDQPIHAAIDALVGRGVSGGPVLDEDGRVLGVLTEADCLSVASDASVYGIPGGNVDSYYSRDFRSVLPGIDLLGLASLMKSEGLHRVLVLDHLGDLVGQLSRRDVLSGVRRMRALAGRYPDYDRPHPV